MTTLADSRRSRWYWVDRVRESGRRATVYREVIAEAEAINDPEVYKAVQAAAGVLRRRGFDDAIIEATNRQYLANHPEARPKPRLRLVTSRESTT